MTDRVLIVGGGAREHAMCAALARSPQAPTLYAALSNANPGILRLIAGHKMVKETDVDAVVAYAQEIGATLVCVGPEAPLEAGLSDALRALNIPVASPSKDAARIETDKAWMRALMEKHQLAGAIESAVFDDPSAARNWIQGRNARVAVKPVGLTGGKGVQVYGDHFQDVDGAMAYVDEVLSKSIGGQARVVLEECLVGEEFTAQAFCDGTGLLPMPGVQDHKRLLPADKGPNTGGMGAYSQSDHLLPFVTQGEYEDAFHILQGIIDALAAEGCPYVGPIYGQFMLTPEGPRVIEINARFGDPEAMNVLSLLTSDYLEICKGMAAGSLAGIRAEFAQKATVVKYIVPEGYGSGTPMAGIPIHIDEPRLRETECLLFYAAVNGEGDQVTTTTSRALAVLAMDDTLGEANERCEAGLTAIKSEHVHIRHDIGTKELIQRRIDHMKALRVTPRA